MKDPAGALASPGCATRYSLCLSPHILQISRKPSIQQCTDCGLKRWHSTIPTLCSACTDFAKPSGRISRPVPFPHSSGTQSIQINAAKVEFCSHFCPLPSRAGVPWTAGKDFLQWSNTQERQNSREGEGEGGKELWFRSLFTIFCSAGEGTEQKIRPEMDSSLSTHSCPLQSSLPSCKSF